MAQRCQGRDTPPANASSHGRNDRNKQQCPDSPHLSSNLSHCSIKMGHTDPHRVRCGPAHPKSAVGLLLQLCLEICEVEVLSVRLNFAFCVDFQNADAVHEENVSGPRLET